MLKHTIIQKDNKLVEKNLTPLKAIREKCGECSNWNVKEIRECPITDCALYCFRSGKSGNKRDLSDEQRKALSERFKITHS